MRMRRRVKRLPEMAQRTLGFAEGPIGGGPEPTYVPGDDWFQPEGHRALRVGEEPLDRYLRRIGLEWVVELRSVLEALDWRLLTRAYQPTGRKAKHPRVMVGLIVYGILCARWSLRELELLAGRDVGAWWISGGHQPDHSTIGEFIERHRAVLTTGFFESLVRHLVQRLRVQPGTAALDGTVVEAAASRFRTLKLEAAQQAAAQARQRAHDHPQDAQAQAAAQAAAVVAAAASERAERRASKGRDRQQTAVAVSDPAAVLQPRKDGAWRPAYKPSTLVHEAGLIVGHSVHPSNETAQVAELLAQHHTVLGAPPVSLLMDANYCYGEVLALCVADEIDVLCPGGTARQADQWSKRGMHGRFGKGAFHYDEAQDTYRCPAGQELRRVGQRRDRAGRGYWHYEARAVACGSCALRAQCTTAKQARSLKRYAADEYKEAMRAVFEQPRARQKYGQRRTLGERVYAEFTERQGLRRFHRRGLAGVSVEWALHCIAFDLKVALRHPAASFLVARCVLVARFRRLGRVWARVGVAGAAYTEWRIH
jgi:transposase